MEDVGPRPESRIFISYRREDSSGHVLALLPALRRRFGANRVFKDTDNIPPGEDFLKHIRRELETCSVLLAIIGREWLTVQDPRLNRPRLENPNDFLRVEVGTALARESVRVIPVLVERASMPSADDLPPDLKALSYRNALELSDARWDSDVQLLIDAIERSSNAAPAPAPAFVRPELVELQKRRAREIAAHLRTANQAFDSDDYDATLLACEKVLLLDPDHPEALACLDRARKAADERKISTWLAQAQALLRQGEVGDSSDLIDQALAVDHTSETALALRKEMLNYRRERERDREKAKLVSAATEQARTCLDDGDFEGAIRHAEDALNADPEAADARDIRTRAAAAVEKRRADREVKRRAQQAVSEARAMAAAGDYANARRLLHEFTPVHDVVVEALEKLQKEVEDVESRERRLAELTSQAAKAVAARRFDHAVGLLTEAVGLDSQRADVARLLEDARARQAADAAAQRALQEGAARFGSGDYPGARQSVEAAQGQDPRHPEVQEWLRRIDEAVAEGAAAADRSEAVRVAVADARNHLATGDLASARRRTDEALALDPASPDAQELSARLRTAVAERRARDEQQQRAVAAAEHARRLFDAEDHAAAIQALERFTPPHPLVAEALAALRGELLAIEARRRQHEEEAVRQRRELERATEARKRAEALRAILARGEASLRREDHVEGLRAADEALRQDPESSAARELRVRALSLRERREREDRERLEQERQHQKREEHEREARERQAEEAGAGPAHFPADYRSRRWTWLGAAAALILVAVIALGYYRGRRSPPESSGEAVARSAPVEPAAVPPSQAPPQQTPAPNLPAEKPATITPGPGPASTHSAAPAEDERRRQQVAKLRATARDRYRTGQLPQALSAAAAGLALAPGDPELTSLLDSLMDGALSSARQARARATSADAATHAKDVWGQAVKAEETGDRARSSNNKGAAARSYWTAADQYDAATRQAADHAQKLAAATRLEPEPPKSAPPPAASERPDPEPAGVPSPPRPQPEDKPAENRPPTVSPPPPGPVSTATEKSRIGAVLDRYQAAYDSLDALAVKSVYPSVRADLPAIFESYLYYKLDLVPEDIEISADGQRAVAKCRLFHSFQARINARSQQMTTRQDISLEKRGETWVIVGLRNR